MDHQYFIITKMINFHELSQYMSVIFYGLVTYHSAKILYLLFCKIYVIGKTSKNAFRYLGLELNQIIQNITLDQIHYINLLQ